MITGLVDTNILIAVYRNNRDMRDWLASQPDLAVPSVVWLEFIQGANGKLGQTRCLEILSSFSIVMLTASDQLWAMDRLKQYQFSHGTHFTDCLIASVAERIQVPIYTYNVADFLVVLPPALVIKPY